MHFCCACTLPSHFWTFARALWCICLLAGNKLINIGILAHETSRNGGMCSFYFQFQLASWKSNRRRIIQDIVLRPSWWSGITWQKIIDFHFYPWTKMKTALPWWRRSLSVWLQCVHALQALIHNSNKLQGELHVTYTKNCGHSGVQSYSVTRWASHQQLSDWEAEHRTTAGLRSALFVSTGGLLVMSRNGISGSCWNDIWTIPRPTFWSYPW